LKVGSIDAEVSNNEGDCFEMLLLCFCFRWVDGLKVGFHGLDDVLELIK
jgi:hypothetical protein